MGIGCSSTSALAVGTLSALPALTHEEADYYMAYGEIVPAGAEDRGREFSWLASSLLSARAVFRPRSVEGIVADVLHGIVLLT